MQQEAFRRVREMQKKSQSYINAEPPQNKAPEHTSRPQNKEPPPPPKMSESHQTQPNQHNQQNHQNQQRQCRPNMSNPFAQLFGSNLGGFNRYKNCCEPKKPMPEKPPEHHENEQSHMNPLDFRIDEEKAILLMLIYLLYKNGADIKLIIALAYLLI